MAWLNARPEKSKEDKSPAPAKTRREQLDDTGVQPAMPECDVLHLVGYLMEVGPSIAGNALTHGEIAEWQRNTGTVLDSWEARTLRRLSIEYLSESHKATAADCPPPWEESAPIVRTLKAEASRRNLRALAQSA